MNNVSRVIKRIFNNKRKLLTRKLFTRKLLTRKIKIYKKYINFDNKKRYKKTKRFDNNKRKNYKLRKTNKKQRIKGGDDNEATDIESNKNGSMNDNNNKDKPFKKKQCAPKKNKMQDFTCYDNDSLLKIRNLWNARHKDMKIETTVPREIWNELKIKMKSACDSESCWLNQKFMENGLDSKLLKYTFAPKSPDKWKKNHNTWLNSLDIEKVMKQYEHEYPAFRFIGPTPIDFDKHTYENTCVWDDLCKFELKDYLDKSPSVNKIGVIFNTDPHDKSGAHWISLFIDIKKEFIFFFDSNGTKMPNEVKKFAEKVIEQARKQKIKLQLVTNTQFSHQKGNTECGMYSLYMLITLLTEAHDYTFFKTTKISDDAMEALRDKYFNVAG